MSRWSSGEFWQEKFFAIKQPVMMQTNIQAENTPFSPLCNKIINKLHDDTSVRPSSGPPVLWSGPMS